MDRQSHLICENAQWITLYAWPIIYGKDNQYDIDSRDVMAEFRSWAEEFEAWWQSHDEDWQECADYPTEIDNFAEKKVQEYIKQIEE